jgi:L-arginine dehydrogenase
MTSKILIVDILTYLNIKHYYLRTGVKAGRLLTMPSEKPSDISLSTLPTRRPRGGPFIVPNSELDLSFGPADVLSAMRRAFAGLAAGTSNQPPQSVAAFPGRPGDVISYFGLLGEEDVFGVKLSPYFPNRTDGPKVAAWTMLCSMSTGQPLLVCDSYALTVERTASTTMLALDYLAPQSSKSLLVVGIGSVGIAHLRHSLALRNWDSVQVFSPRLTRDRSLVKYLVPELCGQLKIAASLEEAVRTADVVLLCTSSGTAVIDQRWVRENSVVTSISTNARDAHEVPPEALAGWEVFCDYRATTPRVAGEMVLASQRFGWSSEAILADLPQLIAGTGKLPTRRAPVFFRSVGLGIEDMALANLILRRLESSPSHHTHQR